MIKSKRIAVAAMAAVLALAGAACGSDDPVADEPAAEEEAAEEDALMVRVVCSILRHARAEFD